MDPIIIAIIIVLCQYPIAVLTLMKLFRCRLEKTQTIVWNFVIVLIPFLGSAIFWIYYLIAKNKIKENVEKKRRMPPLGFDDEKEEDAETDGEKSDESDVSDDGAGNE